MTKLNKEEHRAIAILGGAYLDHAIQLYLQANFVTLAKEDANRMFDAGQNGFLSSFSAKLRLCMALGLIGRTTYNDLTILNDIRNVFAHLMHKIDFSHPLVAQDCERLDLGRFFEPHCDPKAPAERFCAAIDGIYLGLSAASREPVFSRAAPNPLLA